jgi:hypothetical protein
MRRGGLALVLGLALLLEGCFASEDPLRRLVSPNTALRVSDQDNRVTELTNLDDWRAAVPFAVVAPSYVPRGTTMTVLQAHVPAVPAGSAIDPVRVASVTMSFTGERGSFMLTERLGATSSLDGGTPVSFGKWRGEAVETPSGAGRTQAGLHLAWTACGLSFSMTSSVPGLSQQEAMRIAASTLDACD